jgi:hypothetical protein
MASFLVGRVAGIMLAITASILAGQRRGRSNVVNGSPRGAFIDSPGIRVGDLQFRRQPIAIYKSPFFFDPR